MELTINDQGNYLLCFSSNINLEDSYTTRSLGNQTSTMELFLHDGWTVAEGSGFVEWFVESLDEVECVGLWWENGELVDYDGVFSLPKQVRLLLWEIGVIVPDEFFDE